MHIKIWIFKLMLKSVTRGHKHNLKLCVCVTQKSAEISPGATFSHASRYTSFMNEKCIYKNIWNMKKKHRFPFFFSQWTNISLSYWFLFLLISFFWKIIYFSSYKDYYLFDQGIKGVTYYRYVSFTSSRRRSGGEEGFLSSYLGMRNPSFSML